jgi:hypothetical protein
MRNCPTYNRHGVFRQHGYFRFVKNVIVFAVVNGIVIANGVFGIVFGIVIANGVFGIATISVFGITKIINAAAAVLISSITNRTRGVFKSCFFFVNLVSHTGPLPA